MVLVNPNSIGAGPGGGENGDPTMGHKIKKKCPCLHNDNKSLILLSHDKKLRFYFQMKKKLLLTNKQAKKRHGVY